MLLRVHRVLMKPKEGFMGLKAPVVLLSGLKQQEVHQFGPCYSWMILPATELRI